MMIQLSTPRATLDECCGIARIAHRTASAVPPAPYVALWLRRRCFHTPGTRILSRRSVGSETITAVCGSVTLI